LALLFGYFVSVKNKAGWFHFITLGYEMKPTKYYFLKQDAKIRFLHRHNKNFLSKSLAFGNNKFLFYGIIFK